jgi:iron(III) transport system substrate-binding protein
MFVGKFISAGLAILIGLQFNIAFAQDDTEVVNLYTSRHYQTDEALYSDFTELTGITVNRIEAGGDALIERLKNEGLNSPADIYMSVDAGTMWRAEEAGLLAPTISVILNARIPQNFRHPDGKWYGYSARARLIIYNKNLINQEDIQSYEDLANPKWHGLICIRSSSNIYNLSLLASLIENDGVVEAEAWAKGVVHNFARDPQGGDTDQIRAVASGECGLALANSYYYARLMRSNMDADKAVVAATGIIFPNQSGRGTHVNISGAGIVATAPNPDNAMRFLEYLASDSAQKYFAEGNNEYPVVSGLLENEALIEMGEFATDTLNVSVFGMHQAEAQRVFDRAGWK